MRRIRVWGRDLEVQGSPYTYLAFKGEFGGDLGTHIMRAYQGETYAMEDFLRIVWAMCKTRDERTAGYETWLREWPEGDFSVLEGADQLAVIMQAVDAELFRARETRIRRWARRARDAAARALGRARRRLGRRAPRLHA